MRETKIDSRVSNAGLFPPELGYSIFRKDHVMGGGGVLLSVKSDLNSTPSATIALQTSKQTQTARTNP